MHPLEYVALIFFLLAVVRTFSFGVYGLRQGRGGTFALALLLILTGAVLVWFYAA